MNAERLIRNITSKATSKMTADSPNKSAEESIKNKIISSTIGNIVCGVSVRHIHLCQEHVDVLFGKDHEMQILRELYQYGNYAYKETVTIVGPKLNTIQNIRVLGPLRDQTQVELAKTDCIKLDIDAPVKPSGRLTGTAHATIIGPMGAVYLKEGVIRANRHLHLSSDDAKYFDLKDNDEVDVRIPGPKGLTFNNVQVRTSPKHKSEMHVDTDDANAEDIVNGTPIDIVDVSCISSLFQN